MAYVDTSVLLALFLNEPKTADAWSWLDRQALGATTVSDWTLTEVSSALSVKRRMNMFDDQTYSDVLAKVRHLQRANSRSLHSTTPIFSEPRRSATRGSWA